MSSVRWWIDVSSVNEYVKLSMYRPGQVLRVPQCLDSRHVKMARLSALVVISARG